MNREQAIAYKEVHDKCGMEVLRKLTPGMSDESRAVMLEWAERGGVPEWKYGDTSDWETEKDASFHAGVHWRLRPEPSRMAFVEGPGGRYEYPEPFKERGSLRAVWAAYPAITFKHMKREEVELVVRLGIAHATREAAEAHRRAEILARGGEV